LLSLPLVFFASLVLLVSLNVCLVLELDDEDNGGDVLIGQSELLSFSVSVSVVCSLLFFFVRSFSSNKNNGSEIGATEEEVESVSF
jgi:hypothetical protein